MADGTKIEWTDATWNPITGCEIVSPGCKNCYAMKLAGTRMKHHWSRKDLTVPSARGPVWNGRVRLNQAWLDQPLRWKRPRRIFVCAHGDLFYEQVPSEWIDLVFAVMALAPQHTFQVLTKRPARMDQYTNFTRARMGSETLGSYEMIYNAMGVLAELDLVEPHPYRAALPNGMEWPLPNVWLGTSVEDQKRADERLPSLIQANGAKKFVSYEPALGPVDWLGFENFHEIDQVIFGGESGRDKRPVSLEWARWTLDHCRSADVAFYMKQVDKIEPIPVDLMVREEPER